MRVNYFYVHLCRRGDIQILSILREGGAQILLMLTGEHVYFTSKNKKASTPSNIF